MKPHLKKFRGIWHCYCVPFIGERGEVLIGLGFTPADAWVDWKRMTNTEGNLCAKH